MTRWQDIMGAAFGTFTNVSGKALDSIIYGAGFTDDDKAKVKYFVSGIPLLGDVLVKNPDDYKRMKDYLQNTGQSWSDVKYPGKVSGQSWGSAVNFVSKNLEKIYDN